MSDADILDHLCGIPAIHRRMFQEPCADSYTEASYWRTWEDGQWKCHFVGYEETDASLRRRRLEFYANKDDQK